MRQTIFELLDHMSARKQELTDKFVPVSICTQLQQAIRDTEVSCLLFCFFFNLEIRFRWMSSKQINKTKL